MAIPAHTPASLRSTTRAEGRLEPPAPGDAAAGERQLRILLALESAGAGVGRHVLDLARGLLQRGHDVHLAWSPLRAEPGFVAALRTLVGLVAHEVPMTRAPGPSDARAVIALRRLLAQHRYDLAHGHSSKAGALVRLACAGRGVPALYTPHAFITLDPELGALDRVVYGGAERLLAPLATRIVCVSGEEEAHARRLGISPGRLVVIPNGIAPLPPPDRAAARRALGLDAAAVCAGFVGRLSRQKAVERLVMAFALASPPGSAGRLVIVGEGPERASLEALAARLGLAGRATFPGAADGAALMAAFDVFVLPSVYEGFPYVLLEAAARGLPIVSAEVGGAAAVVRDGHNGAIVAQAAGAEAMARALAAPLARLLGDPALRESMGRNSATAAARLDADTMVGRTLALYREVLATAG